MECKIGGEPTPTIQWFRDSQEITDNKKYKLDYSDMVASIKVMDITEKDAASITCEASNELGSVKTTGQLEVQGKIFTVGINLLLDEYKVTNWNKIT